MMIFFEERKFEHNYRNEYGHQHFYVNKHVTINKAKWIIITFAFHFNHKTKTRKNGNENERKGGQSTEKFISKSNERHLIIAKLSAFRRSVYDSKTNKQSYKVLDGQTHQI